MYLMSTTTLHEFEARARFTPPTSDIPSGPAREAAESMTLPITQPPMMYSLQYLPYDSPSRDVLFVSVPFSTPPFISE